MISTHRRRSSLAWLGLFSARFCGVAATLCLAALPLRAAETYDIDVVLPLTGPAALLGTGEQQALRMFESTPLAHQGIASRPVHFVYHDDQSSPQTAVQLAAQIAGQRSPVVIGSTLVATCNAMAPMMRHGPVMYCLSPGIYPPAGSFVFSASSATHDLLTAQVRYFRARGWTQIALITSTDASGMDARKQLAAVLATPENKNIHLVAESTFNPADVSAAAQVARLKAAAPQALIAWSTGAAIGTVFKAIQEAGLDLPVATTDGNMIYPQMRQYAEMLPKQLYFASPEWPATVPGQAPPGVEAAKAEFFAAAKRSNASPDLALALSWDAGRSMVLALGKLGPAATADQLRGYIDKLQNFAGVQGMYDFVKVPQRGLGPESDVVTRWTPASGTWTVVSHPGGLPLD